MNERKVTDVSTEQTRNKHTGEKVTRKGNIDEKVKKSNTSRRKTHDGGDHNPPSDGSDSDGNGDSDHEFGRGSKRDKRKKRRNDDDDPGSDNESTKTKGGKVLRRSTHWMKPKKYDGKTC